MKIGFVTRELPPSKRIGGIGVVVWDGARSLAEKGHKVTIISASDDINEDSDRVVEGVRVIRLSGADFFLGKKWSVGVAVLSRIRRWSHFISYRKKVADTIDRLVAQGEIEIVEFPEYGNEAEVWSRRRRTIPMVVRLHGPTILDRNTGRKLSPFKYPFQAVFGRMELATVKRANAISAVSRAVGDFVARYADIPSESIVPIHNGIASKTWSRGGVDDIIGNKSHCFRVFSAGSVVLQKGFWELVEAVSFLRESGMKIQLVIAGKLGVLGRKLHNLSQDDHKYGSWLKILDVMPREQLAAYYSGADLVVFPSWWEPFGTVCIEAMSVKALVLASSAGGWAELITEGKDGFLITPKNSRYLAQKIKFLLLLPENEKARIKMAASRKIADNLDFEVIMSEQLRFYHRVKVIFSKSNSSN